jgi:hypothetical protein
MKRLLLTLVAFAGLTAGLLIAAHNPAEAGRTYDLRDLRGTYYFVVTEIRFEHLPGIPDPVMDYCTGYGTITFDGAGGAAISSGTRRCSATGTVTDSGNFTYTVNSDGSFLLTEVGFADPSHGQILDNGNMILVDGTLRNPDILLWQGVGVKL